MHNQQLMKETHQEVSRYYALSLTPLTLLGIPRCISGKTMDQWRGIPVIYALAVAYYILTLWLRSYSEAIATGLLWGAVATLSLAVICHLGLICQDVRMFKSIMNRLESLIE